MFKWNTLITGQKHLTICVSLAKPLRKSKSCSWVANSTSRSTLFAVSLVTCLHRAVLDDQGRGRADGTNQMKNAVRIRVCYEVSDKKRNVWFIQEGRLVANQLLDVASSLLTYKYSLLKYSFLVKRHAFLCNRFGLHLQMSTEMFWEAVWSNKGDIF